MTAFGQSKKEQLAILTSRLDSLNKEHSSLSNQYAEANKQIKDKSNTIKSLNSKNTELVSDLKEKSDNIKSLNSKNKELMSEIEEMRKAQEEQIALLMHRLDSLNKEMIKVKEQNSSNESDHKLTELTEKDIDIELSLKEESSWCFIKDIFKKNNDVYIVVDFFTVGTEYDYDEEGNRWEIPVIVNNNPKLRTYKINLENGNEDIYFDSYSGIISAINGDATCEIETKNGEVIFLVNAGIPG